MAGPFLPVRALTRGNKVRIGTKTLSNTITSFLDLSDGVVRRDLARNSTFGSYVVVGGLLGGTLADRTLVTGVVVTANSPEDTTADISAGKVYTEEVTGEITVAAVANQTFTAAHATDERIDLIQVNVKTGATSIVVGTPAAASPATPSAATDNVAIATVYRHPLDDATYTTDNVIRAANITDVAPRG